MRHSGFDVCCRDHADYEIQESERRVKTGKQ